MAERYDRRRVMMTSAAACSTCWIIITGVLALTASVPGNSYDYAAVAIIVLFVCLASVDRDILGVPRLYPTKIDALET